MGGLETNLFIVIRAIFSVVFVVWIDHRDEMDSEHDVNDEKEYNGRVDNLSDRLLTLLHVVRVDASEATILVFDIITCCLPWFGLLQLWVSGEDANGKAHNERDCEAVEEESAPEFRILKDHEDESSGTETVSSHSQRIELFQLL